MAVARASYIRTLRRWVAHPSNLNPACARKWHRPHPERHNTSKEGGPTDWPGPKAPQHRRIPRPRNGSLPCPSSARLRDNGHIPNLTGGLRRIAKTGRLRNGSWSPTPARSTTPEDFETEACAPHRLRHRTTPKRKFVPHTGLSKDTGRL
jgi:hypothetical protein